MASFTRRTWFEALAGSFVVASLPPVLRAGEAAAGEGTMAGSGSSSYTAELCRYMAAAGDLELPANVLEQAKNHILDTIAAMVSGADLPPAVVGLKFARAHTGEPACTIVGANVLCGPLEAALVNGVLAQSDETDDSHAPSHTHPGCSIVPSAMAAGEYFHVSGARFLRSVVLGYDVGTRIAMALGGLPFQMKTHRSTHSIGANFGSAAAAGCAAKLSEQQMHYLIDYACQQAAGTAAWQRDTQHSSKALVFGGMPARNGVTAALMVQLGATGVVDTLSGPDNFLIANSPTADPAKLINLLGKRFEVTRTNIKKWTVGSPIQAPLDAIELIRKRHPFDADDVKSVVVRVATSEAKTVNNREMPDISMQHLVAVMLIDKTVSFAAAHDQARMSDPQVLRVKAKVRLVGDENLEKLYPQRQTILEITFNDGATETERVTAVRGTAENPMTSDEVVTKARDLMTPMLGADQTGRLIDALMTIEKADDIVALRPLYQRQR